MTFCNHLREYSSQEQFHIRWNKSKNYCSDRINFLLDHFLNFLDEVHFEKRLEVEIPKGLFKNVTFVVDVTEYPVHNTCNKETSRELWSGKAHMPSLKCEDAVRPNDGYFIHWSGGIPRVNDSKMFELGPLLQQLQPWERGIGDKAYIKFPQLITPLKGVDLSDEEKFYNSIVSSVRSIVERAIGRLKKFRILSDPYRGDLVYHHRIFGVLVNFVNIDIQHRPLVACENPFLYL